MINFGNFPQYERFREAWESVEIVRSVAYTLFTFGDSDLPYYLVCSPEEAGDQVSIRRGDVKVSRPLIITAGQATPQFRDFFDGQEDEDIVKFLLARSARFPNMKFSNVVGSKELVSDNVEEAVARIIRKLDNEEEDRVGVLTAPSGLGGVAVLRYCLERMAQSTPDNLTELQERGLLP